MKRKKLSPEERIASRKEALKRYYLKNKEKILKYTSNHSKKNRDKGRENLRRWRSENKERYNATTQAWLEKNPDSQKNRSKKYWDKNKDRIRSEHREWIKKNPHLSNAYNGKRRHNTKFHPDADHISILSIYKETHRLSKSHGYKFSTDHIIPVAAGGFHHEKNLQSLPKSMNESKHDDSFWIAPMGYKDWRDVPRDLWPAELKHKYIALIEQNKGVSIRWDTAA